MSIVKLDFLFEREKHGTLQRQTGTQSECVCVCVSEREREKGPAADTYL
jgi:hypothetical protein